MNRYKVSKLKSQYSQYNLLVIRFTKVLTKKCRQVLCKSSEATMIKGSDIQIKVQVNKGLIQYKGYYNGQLIAIAWSIQGAISQALIQLNKGIKS